MTFAYARAGHEPPLLLNPDGSVERVPHGPGMSLGLWEEITLDLQVVHLPPGSTLLLFTDGMTDCRDPKGVQFGLSRINQTLSRPRGPSGADSLRSAIADAEGLSGRLQPGR